MTPASVTLSPCHARTLSSEFTTVAKTGVIPEGQGITVVLGDRLVAVFNSGGEYFAIDDLCPHMGASLGAGEVDEGVVTCPWHAWRFKVVDGTWCDNPRIKIDSFETRVVGDEIQIRPRDI
jgi:nitrite reductase (NADH) small subunit/3-phenylpropionate/trans-cinnamate dioxygenase ferredoxin subunit